MTQWLWMEQRGNGYLWALRDMEGVLTEAMESSKWMENSTTDTNGAPAKGR